MAYEKTEWKARKGTNLNRFRKEQESSNFVILHNEPSSITEPGTPFNIENMNKIEQGIFDAHEMIVEENGAWLQAVADETAAREQGDTELALKLAEESEERQKGDQNLQQAVNQLGTNLSGLNTAVTDSFAEFNVT